MSFVHPSLAWGVVLGLIPIIIYYLWRRRFQVLPWAAVDFLLAALRRQSRKVKLQDALLLALRVVALVLAALVFARPVLSPASARTVGVGREAVDAVIVLDTSYSMQTSVGGRTRMAIARARTQELLRALPPGSRAALVRTDAPSVVLPEKLSEDLAAIAAFTDGIEASSSAGDLAPALVTAQRTLEGSKAPAQALYIVTDAQTRFMGEDAMRAGALLRTADSSLSVTVLTVPHGRTANVAITGLEVRSRVLALGAPVDLEAVVEDVGEPRTAEAGLELHIDGRKVERVRATLADGRARVRFRHAFTSAGLHALEVRLDPDALEADNHRFAAVHVAASIDVAVIEAKDDTARAAGAHAYIDAALGAGAAGGLPPFVVRRRLGADLPPADIVRELDDQVAVVVLADPGPLPAAVLEALHAFAQNGGGVLLSAGPDAARSLGQFREGGSGAWLADLELVPPDAEDALLRLDTTALRAGGENGAEGREMPLFDPDVGGMEEALGAVSFLKALAIRVPPGSAWTVQARFDAARPALVTAARNGRRTILFASTLDGRWCDLPYRPAMVPLLVECMEWLVRERQVAPELACGRTWVLSWAVREAASADDAGRLVVTCPEGAGIPAEASIVRHGATNELRFERTTTPGVYVLGGKALPGTLGARAAAAVNVESAESAQDAWTAAQIAALLPDGRSRDIDAAVPLDERSVERASGIEIAHLLALCLGLVLAVECVLAWRFSAAGSASSSGGRP